MSSDGDSNPAQRAGAVTICRARNSSSEPCPNPAADGPYCPLHTQRKGFASRFRRTFDHPIYQTTEWRRLSRRTVRRWVEQHGWVCPGWRRAAHAVSEGKLHADHTIPLVLGGDPLPARLGVLCASCNARKGLSQRPRRPGGASKRLIRR